MKYLKKFEINDGMPKIGDYVLCYEDDFYDPVVESFFKNNIGIIIKLPNDNDRDVGTYSIKYENIPSEINYYFFKDMRSFYFIEIEHWCSNKEDLEQYIDANKYNL